MVVVQLPSHVWLFAAPWTAAHQPFLSFTISQSLLKLISIEFVIPSTHLILYCSLLLLPSIFPSMRVFSNELDFASGGQTIGASASAAVPQMNIQGYIPLGLTGLISLLSRGFSSLQLPANPDETGNFNWWSKQAKSSQGTTNSSLNLERSNCVSLLSGPTLAPIHDYWENHSFEYMDLCWQSDVLCFLILCLGLSQFFFQGASPRQTNSCLITHQPPKETQNPYFTITQVAAPKAEVPFSSAKIYRELNPSCVKSNLFHFS